MIRRFICLFISLAFSYPYINCASPSEEVTDTVGDMEATLLDEFVMVQHKKLVENDGAKLSYNLSEDPEAGSANLLEILRKVPGVTVDAEDNVKVNGKSSYRILINGHEDPILKGDVKTVLKSMPAANVKKIEVISEPGAKYEAEGIGGILNIVTDRKQNLEGLVTQLQGWVNAWQAGGNVNARVKLKNVMLDANVSYNNGFVWPRKSWSDRITENLTDDNNHFEKLHREQRGGWDYTGTRIAMSWEPDSLNLLTLSANYGFNRWGGPQNDCREMFDKDMNRIWVLKQEADNYGKYNGTGVQASYQHNFGREGHNIVASYEFDYAFLKYGTDYLTTFSSGLPAFSPFSSNRTKSDDYSHILQLDYANQIDSHHLLETGAKFNLNSSAAYSNALYGITAADALPDNSQALDMTQLKNIYALYASYTGTFGKWNLKGGVRYEHTYMGLRYRNIDRSDFTTPLNDIVPNAAVSFNFTSASSLRLAYQMRISRPGIQVLNPFVNDLTPGWITYGNPDLKSEHSQFVSLGYSNYEGKVSGSAKVTYSFLSNAINDVIFIKDGLVNSTYANIGQSRGVQFELNCGWDITSDLRWDIYFNADYDNMKSRSELLEASNHGWQYYANTNINYTLPRNIRLNAYGGFHTAWIDLQGRGYNGYNYGLGATKSFLKDDALTLSLNAGNFLPVTRTNKYWQSDDTVKLSQVSHYKAWNVSFSVAWKFGGLKSSMKSTSAMIEKESGSQGARREGK